MVEQVLTVNQVVEILLNFLETRDWKEAFFKVIPQRKRGGGKDDAETEDAGGEDAEDLAKMGSADEDGLEADDDEDVEEEEDINGFVNKKQRIEQAEDAARKVAGADVVEDVEDGEKESIKEVTNGMEKESH